MIALSSCFNYPGDAIAIMIRSACLAASPIASIIDLTALPVIDLNSHRSVALIQASNCLFQSSDFTGTLSSTYLPCPASVLAILRFGQPISAVRHRFGDQDIPVDCIADLHPDCLIAYIELVSENVCGR